MPTRDQTVQKTIRDMLGHVRVNVNLRQGALEVETLNLSALRGVQLFTHYLKMTAPELDVRDVGMSLIAHLKPGASLTQDVLAHKIERACGFVPGHLAVERSFEDAGFKNAMVGYSASHYTLLIRFDEDPGKPAGVYAAAGQELEALAASLGLDAVSVSGSPTQLPFTPWQFKVDCRPQKARHKKMLSGMEENQAAQSAITMIAALKDPAFQQTFEHACAAAANAPSASYRHSPFGRRPVAPPPPPPAALPGRSASSSPPTSSTASWYAPQPEFTLPPAQAPLAPPAAKHPDAWPAIETLLEEGAGDDDPLKQDTLARIQIATWAMELGLKPEHELTPALRALKEFFDGPEIWQLLAHPEADCARFVRDMKALAQAAEAAHESTATFSPTEKFPAPDRGGRGRR